MSYWSKYMGHHHLKDKNLNEVRLHPEGHSIVFVCKEGTYAFEAWGDCCSYSWIESVDGPTEGKIIGWDDNCFESNFGDHSELKKYSCKLSLEGKGYLDIQYRNESNGYYGGDLEYLENLPEGWEEWRKV